jgi:hypothetical protein
MPAENASTLRLQTHCRHFGKRIQCMSSPTDICNRKPRSKNSDMKRAGLVQLQVLNYTELEIPKPGIQHPQEKGAGCQQSTHLSKVLQRDTSSRFSGEGVEATRKGGMQKTLQYILLAIARAPFRQRDTPRTTTTVTYKCADRL